MNLFADRTFEPESLIGGNHVSAPSRERSSFHSESFVHPHPAAGLLTRGSERVKGP